MLAHKAIRHGCALVPACLLLLSCTGSIGDLAADGDETSGSGSGNRNGPAPPAPDTPLRRLTRIEHANSLRDLLFLTATDAGQVLNQLPPENLDGWDNDAEKLKVDVGGIDKFDAVASEAID